MTSTHIIENGIVVNTIVAMLEEARVAYPDALCLDANQYPGGIGWTWDGEQLVSPPAPPEPVPEEVEGWQAEVAMKATPVDPNDPESQSVWDRVQDIITAMPDGIEKITAQTVLARGKIRRDSPMLAQLAPLVPLSEERVDDLMRLAASIEA